MDAGRHSVDIVETVPPSSPERNTSGHRRSSSGNLLSRLSFFRSSSSEGPSSSSASNPRQSMPFPRISTDGAEDVAQSISTAKRGGSMAAVFGTGEGHNEKTRNRKGSLRKAALLGTGLLRRYSGSDGAKKEKDRKSEGKIEVPVEPSPKLTMETALTTPTLLSPITSPTGPYASTTSDDDGLIFCSTVKDQSPSPPSSKASINVPSTLPRRRSSTKPSQSPLANLYDLVSTEEEWDYSETEFWGWIILTVTWIVFVVGMGSCLGVWSWAWDVGETPYAPPELSNDDSLPIVGYYPALLVLSAVMSWIWVVVAWGGMKIFKHSSAEP